MAMATIVSSVKQRIQRNLVNSLSLRTKRKLIVIESDDWGSIRMPSKSSYDDLLRQGAISEKDPFAKFDSLASNEDLEKLFETLISFKDFKGNPPVITANTIVANPNFSKIKETEFKNYYFEKFTETLKRYPCHNNSFNLWNEGINNKCFKPQLHGREHLNIFLWLDKLREKEESLVKAFEHSTFTAKHSVSAAFSYHNQEDKNKLNDIIVQGHQIFQDIFGFPSKTFIAPNYTWDSAIEHALKDEGIYFIQGTKKQNVPQINSKSQLRIKKRFHFTGEKNQNNQMYFVRNCLFEPSISPNIDYVDKCLKHISNAFYWNTPAIIGSHRLNYVGYIDPRNRDRNLDSLKHLVNSILKKWPMVEFISSSDLAEIVTEN